MHIDVLNRHILYCRSTIMWTLEPKFHLARHIMSRHDTTRSTCRAHRDDRVEPCCSTSSTQQKCMGSNRQRCRVDNRTTRRQAKSRTSQLAEMFDSKFGVYNSSKCYFGQTTLFIHCQYSIGLELG